MIGLEVSMIHDFTPLSAVVGGAMIGLSATLLLWSHGRIAGISGIWGGLSRSGGEGAWRLLFVAGLLAGGVSLWLVLPAAFASPVGRPLGQIALAGVLVGVGTRLSNGCTSGHGVCGLSRLSGRSLVAVLTFMGVGIVTASVLGAVVGGAP